MKGTKGFSLLEVLIASTTLVVIVLMIIPQFTKNRRTLTSLQSGASCEALANFLATNIGSRKNSVPTRTFYISGDGQRPIGVGGFTGNLVCNGAHSCDLRDHFESNGGNPIFRNYQNIRSAATWANYWWNNHPAGNCTATHTFAASGVPAPLTDLQTFLPAQIDPGEFNTLINDASGERQVDSVIFQITQVRGQGLANPNDCLAGVETQVKPNSNFSFDIAVTVNYRKRDQRGVAGTGTPSSCQSRTNVTYGFDREIRPIPTVIAGNGILGAGFPAVFVPSIPIGNPPITSAGCNPTPRPPSTTTEAAYDSDEARVFNLTFLGLEAGTIPICRATETDLNDVPISIQGWRACQSIVLGGLNAAQVNPPNLNNGGGDDGRWRFNLQWGTVGAGQPKIPLGRKITLVFRPVDTAGNCNPNDVTCSAERTFYFEVRDYCTSSWQRLFCPGEIIPSGCGNTCVNNDWVDFSGSCPPVANYFACETRCGRCDSVTGGTTYPSCAQLPTRAGPPPVAPHTGSRAFTRVPGDNFCPPANTYCAGTPTREVPCGGACAPGTLDDRGNYCAGHELDSCGRDGTKNDCTGVDPATLLPNNSRGAGDPAEPPRQNRGCDPGYVPYCPPANTYCGNTRFNDQCGNACPPGSDARGGCCDQCNSGIQDFEDEAECLNPAIWLPNPPPASCSVQPRPGGGGTFQCFVPN